MFPDAVLHIAVLEQQPLFSADCVVVVDVSIVSWLVHVRLAAPWKLTYQTLVDLIAGLLGDRWDAVK